LDVSLSHTPDVECWHRQVSRLYTTVRRIFTMEQLGLAKSPPQGSTRRFLPAKGFHAIFECRAYDGISGAR
jgi:hypothetical protein